jgi:tRNA-dihydrouridine synthase 4
MIKETCRIPVIANGDIFSVSDRDKVIEKTGCNGVMVARGLLDNPAMFSGFTTTPLHCVKKYLELAIQYGTPASIVQNHLIFMLDKTLSNAEKRYFNSLNSLSSIIRYMKDKDYKDE